MDNLRKTLIDVNIRTPRIKRATESKVHTMARRLLPSDRSLLLVVKAIFFAASTV